jgi:hypothetical protein
MGSDRKESNEGFKMERNSLPRAEWLGRVKERIINNHVA